MALRQAVGNALDVVGTAFKLPELGWSERAAGGNTTYTGYTPQSQAQGYSPARYTPTSRSTPSNIYGQVYGPVNPATGTIVNNGRTQDVLGTQSTGGGGGDSQLQMLEKIGSGRNPIQEREYQQLLAQMNQGPSEEEIRAEVDREYGDVSNLLGAREQSLRGGEQDFYNSFTQPYDAQRPLLDQAKAQGLTLNTQQTRDVDLQEQNAIAAARRLYQELTQGARQRFGGSNSAGDFSNAFLGREFQRNLGQITNTTGQNTQKLVEKAQELQQNYQTQVQSLNMQKEGALSQAKELFRQKLDEINNSRIQLAENKASLKLQALKELRARVQSIQDTALQFTQNLEATRQAADLNLRNAILGYQAGAGKAVGTSAYAAPSYGTVGQTNTINPSNNISGYLGNNRDRNNMVGYYNPNEERRFYS